MKELYDWRRRNVITGGMFGEQCDWLEVVKACYETARRVDEFAGAWIAKRAGWFPSLRTLVKYGILEKRGETVRRGSRAYYVMPDRRGVERALRELGILL